MVDRYKLAGLGVVALGTATATWYYMNATYPASVLEPVPFGLQSSQQEDGSRLSVLNKDGHFLETIFDDVHTAYESIQRGARVSNNGPCLGYKSTPSESYCWLSYNNVLERSENVGAGLLTLGLSPENTTYVGVYSQNRPEYVITDLGLWTYSMVCVPLYDTLGVEACTHIINQAEIKVVVCDTNVKVRGLLSRHKETPDLQIVVVIEEITTECRALAYEASIKLFHFKEIEVKGKENRRQKNLPKPDDVCLICYTSGTTALCYTSGTTGVPKGAMLTHKGTIASCASALQQVKAGGVDITAQDVLISYLPMAHSYERLLQGTMFMSGASVGFFQGDVRRLMDDIRELQPTPHHTNTNTTPHHTTPHHTTPSSWILCRGTMFMSGASVGFFQGDVRRLMDDIRELQPTLFPCVPRLLNRFYDKVITGINASALKRFLFRMALKSKEEELKKRVIRNDSFWDKLVFQKIQAALGGRVRIITSGSAPLSPHVLAFLRCVVGCPLVEGYGQTENHAICAMQLVGDFCVGTVGPPLSCCAIKLTDIPEMGYMASQDRGEVCVKGPIVFKGYLKDQAKTDEALDKEGWLHTGDIGEWTEEGSLRIIDRKKHIFKLAQGEYIAPEKVENVCIQCPLVAQTYIHGESLKSCLVGVVVPDPDIFPAYALQKLNLHGTLEELCKNVEVKKHLLSALTELGKKSGLTAFEIVKDIYVHPELFSVENGLLTPTFKSKRQELAKFFKPQIDAMYSHLA
ncbi:hypothetical protein ACOMHN_006603 [Nucella lapillus]